MSDRAVDHLLIGGGLASGNCARWLREAGGDGSILIVGRETDPPYDRPALTKGYLSGGKTRDDGAFRSPDWYEDQQIELLTRTSVMQFDPVAKTAKLSTGEEVSFGTALLATGANVRRLRADGCTLEGIHYVRAYGNADGIRADIENVGKRVVAIGGSYIGCEIAATLSKLDCEVSIVMLEDQPLERTLGAEIGEWVADELGAQGVKFYPGEELERFEGEHGSEPDDEGRVNKVVTKSGLKLDADLVVIGAGVIPDVSLARAASLEIGDRGGVLCDSKLQTSAAGVYAAGDICEYRSAMHGGTVRVEHWDVAFNHGKTAALNMLGTPTDHEVVPYFWTDLGGWFEIESVGPAYKWDQVIVRGAMQSKNFSAWFIDGTRVAQVAGVNRGDDLEVARSLIASRADVSAQLSGISDPTFDIATLV